MNKAFVREAEAAEPRCPEPAGCGGLGISVTRKTLQKQLPEGFIGNFSESAFYCPNPRCKVAYFDSWGATAPRSELRALTYPKSSTAPVCPCFGITAEEIREDAAAGRRERVRDLLEKAESTAARCATESPTGVHCIAVVRRIFLEHFRPGERP